MAKKKKVSFWATTKVPKRVQVSFRDRYGRRVSFTGTVQVPKRVKVNFWASIKGKKLRKRK